MLVSYTENIEIWVTAENAYNKHLSPVKNQIIARLQGRLGMARYANVMLRVLSKFNALFYAKGSCILCLL